ncbi:SCO family protein [candidate division KSB1 bacterium]
MFEVTLRKYHYLFIFIFFILISVSSKAQLVEEDPVEMQGVTIEDRLGEKIPLDLTFTDQDGKEVILADYFNNGKPVIVTLVYYNCPMLCTLVLNGMVDAMRSIDLEPGEDFTILTVSIDPRETPELSASKQYRYQEAFGKPVEKSWFFHTGDQENITQLADALGFKYYYEEKIDQYVHSAGIFLLTEEGTLSRVLYGINFPPNDLKLGLMEASEGKIGNTIDKLILYCFHYDPDAKGYVAFAGNIMKLGGAATLILLTVFVGTLWTRERLRRPAKAV